MSREIERKFLLHGKPASLEESVGTPITQGYLAIEPRDGSQVRLRKRGGAAFLTVKRGAGAVREECEIALTPAQFKALWPMTAGRRLTKMRHETPCGGHTVEIDVFGGVNQGLVLAEVEFVTEAAARAFIPPGWLGEEVTARPEYGNIVLARE